MEMLKILAAVLFAVCIAGTAALAMDSDVDQYVCPEGPVCSIDKVDYGAMEVLCADGVGDTTARWVCEYEAGYACTREGDGETRSGGVLPEWSRVCAHLCGECAAGWAHVSKTP